jgi:hypothetical protein
MVQITKDPFKKEFINYVKEESSKALELIKRKFRDRQIAA